MAAQLAVGSAAILARMGLDGGLPAVWLSVWRLAVASSALLIGLRVASGRRGRSVALPVGVSARLVAAGMALGVHFAAWFASLQYTSVARSTLLVATAPLWTGLVERFVLRVTPRRVFWWGLAAALVGVWAVVAGQRVSGAGGSAPAGDLLAVIGAIAVSAYMLLTQPLQAPLGTGRVIAWTYSAAAIGLVPAALVLDGPAHGLPATGGAWLSVVGMALVPQLIGHTMLNWSLRHFPAGVIGASTLMEPVFAAGLAWWLFHEPVTLIQVVGGAVVLVGVWVATRGTASAGVSSLEPAPVEG